MNKYALLDAKTAAERALHELNGQLEKRIDERTRAMRETNEALKREIRQREAVGSDPAPQRRPHQRLHRIVFQRLRQHGRGLAPSSTGTIRPNTPLAGPGPKWRACRWPKCCFRRLAANSTGRPSSATWTAAKTAPSTTAPSCLAVTRSGDEITVELTISAYGSDEGLFFGVFLHDVTERQRAEFVLQQERELINAVLETIDVGVVACSAEGELTLFNRGAREFHGLLSRFGRPPRMVGPLRPVRGRRPHPARSAGRAAVSRTAGRDHQGLADGDRAQGHAPAPAAGQRQAAHQRHRRNRWARWWR
ncbi:hypothetical protein LP420_36055 [Massilia sp. B-10]|nr:hypothetical protein LP420_36055 [Massilia sp. B-10]